MRLTLNVIKFKNKYSNLTLTLIYICNVCKNELKHVLMYLQWKSQVSDHEYSLNLHLILQSSDFISTFIHEKISFIIVNSRSLCRVNVSGHVRQHYLETFVSFYFRHFHKFRQKSDA